MTDLLSQAVVPLAITIPYGFCHCGCGKQTRVASRTDASRAYIKGQPIKFLKGHQVGTRPVYVSAPPFKVDGELCRVIPLTKGIVAIIDAEDYDRLWPYKWYARQPAKDGPLYAARNGGKGEPSVVQMHRQIFGAHGKIQVDHRFHNTLDNRKSQLRICSKSENAQNVIRHRDNQTGLKGVAYHKKIDRFTARIMANGELRHLGTFREALAAARAYDDAAIQHHGDFAQLNFSRNGDSNATQDSQR
jgi:hypothetical protein